MRNGTQEELDAAREDMRTLPFGAKFKIVTDETPFHEGCIVMRHAKYDMDDADEVGVHYEDLHDYWYVEWQHLEVIND